MEGSRPYLFDILRVPCGTHPLRDKFLAAVVPGTLQVFSVVANRACQASAQVVGTHVVVSASVEAVELTVMVTGVHKHFPDWDLPLKSDEQRERSQQFWAQEWSPNG